MCASATQAGRADTSGWEREVRCGHQRLLVYKQHYMLNMMLIMAFNPTSTPPAHVGAFSECPVGTHSETARLLARS